MENKNSSPLELVKFLQLEMDNINLQLLITTVILGLASLELVCDDPTWFDTSGIPKKNDETSESICGHQTLLRSLAFYFTMPMCPS